MENVMKKTIILGIVTIMSISLFSCKKIDQNLNSIDNKSINNTQSINETKAFDNEQAIKDAMAVYNVDSSIAEKTIWKKVHHAWPEPPEEQKIYINKEKSQSYVFPYTYKGKEYWINASNGTDENSRYIYEKVSDNYREDCKPKNRAMIVGYDKKEEVWQLLEILEAGDNIVKGVTKGKVEQHTKWGID